MFKISSTEPAHPEIREATLVEYLVQALASTEALDNPTDKIAKESIKLEAVLTSEEVKITEKFKKTMLSQYQPEAQILEAQQTQVTQLRNAVNQIDTSIKLHC